MPFLLPDQIYDSQNQKQSAYNSITGKDISLYITKKRYIMFNTGMSPGIVLQVIQIIPDKGLEMEKQRVIADAKYQCQYNTV